MGKRVSYIDSRDFDYYVLNMPYLDYFILRHMLKAEENAVQLFSIRADHEKKHGATSPSLWSQSVARLTAQGIIVAARKEQLYLSFASPHIRTQMENVFLGIGKLADLIKKHHELKQKFEGGA